MKKAILGFTLRLLILLLALVATARIYLEWTGYFKDTTFVAYLYQDTDFHLIEINQMAELFAAEDAPFESAPLYGTPADRVSEMIEKGATSIILNLEESPTDALIDLAVEQNITLFFVGALPTDAQCANYDKIWCFTESPAYAGELLGEQIAHGFREGEIADPNEDILLDFLFYNQHATYMEPETAVETTLLELDHYGVYTTDLYGAAYHAAVAAAEVAANNAALAEEGTDEESDESTAADASETQNETNLDANSEVSTEIIIPLSSLPKPEVAFSVGSANATYLAEQAGLLEWRDEFTPTALSCIVENRAAAQRLADTELYYSIVYFDTTAATEAVVAMASNAWAQTPVANGTDYAEPENKTFVIPHHIYNMG